jgi:hypothetical protein
MTVSELILLLKSYDKDTKVVIKDQHLSSMPSDYLTISTDDISEFTAELVCAKMPPKYGQIYEKKINGSTKVLTLTGKPLL